MADIASTLAYIGSLCDADETLSEALYVVLTERRNRRKATDTGSPQDSDRSPSATGNRAAYMTEHRRTFGGLISPEPIEDDRQPPITAEYAGGLRLPDNQEPSVPEKLRALFFEKPPTYRVTPNKVITADELAYRQTHGGMLTPDF